MCRRQPLQLRREAGEQEFTRGGGESIRAGDRCSAAPRLDGKQLGHPIQAGQFDHRRRRVAHDDAAPDGLRLPPSPALGWAQVHGFRGETESLDKMEGRIRLDLEYLRRWSLGLDLLIIVRTIRLVFADRAAY